MSMHENVAKRHQDTNRGVRRVVVAGTLVALATATVALLAESAHTFVSQVVTDPPAGGWVLSDLVVGSATSLAVIAAAVLALSGVATALGGDARSGTTAWVATLGPSGYRRLIVAACGSAIALPGLAAPAGAVGPGHDRGSDFPSLAGLSLPDLPTSAHRRPAPRPPIVRVHAGDSLWSIATGLAGPRPSAARIAACVNDLYEVNQHLIGPDPDLIQPGTELTPPGGNR